MVVTKVGIAGRVGVQDYTEIGLGFAFRSELEVKKSAESLVGKAIVLGHEEFVTPDNKDDISLGTITDAFFSEDTGLIVVMFELSSIGDKYVKAGFNQLSIGYHSKPLASKGEWTDTNGVCGIPGKVYPYDHTLTDIKCNHLALCQEARAGDVALIFDSKDKNMSEQLETIQTLTLALKAGIQSLENKITEINTAFSDSLTEVRSEFKDSITEVKTKLETFNEPQPEVETENLDELITKELAHRAEVAQKIGDMSMMSLPVADMVKKHICDMTGYSCDSLSAESALACFELLNCMKDGGWAKASVMGDSKSETLDTITKEDLEPINELKDALSSSTPTNKPKQDTSKVLLARSKSRLLK